MDFHSAKRGHMLVRHDNLVIGGIADCCPLLRGVMRGGAPPARQIFLCCFGATAATCPHTRFELKIVKGMGPVSHGRQYLVFANSVTDTYKHNENDYHVRH